MNLTYEAALQKYVRLCAKSERELRRGHSPLLPYLHAMSHACEFSQPFPAMSELRGIDEQDRQDIILLLHYLVTHVFVPDEFRRQFDRIGA